MSRLDWEKQNKAEKPKEKRKLSNRSKVLKAYENGTKRERERIIKLLEEYLHKLLHNHGLVIIPEQFESLIALIRGEQK